MRRGSESSLFAIILEMCVVNVSLCVRLCFSFFFTYEWKTHFGCTFNRFDCRKSDIIFKFLIPIMLAPHPFSLPLSLSCRPKIAVNIQFIRSTEQIKSIESISNSINLLRDFRDCDIPMRTLCAWMCECGRFGQNASVQFCDGILFAMCFLTNVNVLLPFHRKYTNLI